MITTVEAAAWQWRRRQGAFGQHKAPRSQKAAEHVCTPHSLGGFQDGFFSVLRDTAPTNRRVSGGIPISGSTHTAAASWRVGSVAEPTQRKSQIQQYRGCTARSAHLYQPLISGAMATPMSEPTPTGTPMEAACAQVWQGGTPPDWRRQQAAAAAQGGDGASAARAAPGAAIGAGSMSAAAVPRLRSQSGRRGHPAPAASHVCCDHISWEPGPLTRLRELPIVLLLFARAATGAVRAAGRSQRCTNNLADQAPQFASQPAPITTNP